MNRVGEQATHKELLDRCVVRVKPLLRKGGQGSGGAPPLRWCDGWARRCSDAARFLFSVPRTAFGRNASARARVPSSPPPLPPVRGRRPTQAAVWVWGRRASPADWGGGGRGRRLACTSPLPKGACRSQGRRRPPEGVEEEEPGRQAWTGSKKEKEAAPTLRHPHCPPHATARTRARAFGEPQARSRAPAARRAREEREQPPTPTHPPAHVVDAAVASALPAAPAAGRQSAS